MSTTIAEVRFKAGKLGSMMRQLDLTDGFPMLREGAVTYGRAHRFYIVKQGQSGQSEPPLPMWSNYLGMTKAEALEKLDEAIDAMYEYERKNGLGNNVLNDALSDQCGYNAVSNKAADWKLWSDVAPWSTEMRKEIGMIS